jgi:feruloyl esterase
LFSRNIASGSSQYVIFPEVSAKDGDIPNFAFTQANFDRLATLHPLYDATDTDLAPFQAKGGKLILWHGWSDQHISPLNTVAYFEGVKKALGEAKTGSFARLFLFPGVYHCGGGEGFTQFDVLSPLIAWVEHGAAPDRIMADKIADRGPGGGPPRGGGERPAPLQAPASAALATRPVFAYPQVAHYTGSGDVNNAANYVAVTSPALDPSVLRLAGAAFMAPDVLRTYEVKDGKLVMQHPG